MPHDKALRLINQQAQAGEKPLFYIIGTFKQTIACFADRCVIAKPGFMAGATFGGVTTTFYYRDITGVQAQAKLTTGYLEILTSSYQANSQKSYWSRGKDDSPDKLPNCIPMMSIDQKKQATQIQRLRELVAQAHSPVAAPASPAGDDLVSKLERLNALRSSGAITDSDYETAKAKLLSEG